MRSIDPIDPESPRPGVTRWRLAFLVASAVFALSPLAAWAVATMAGGGRSTTADPEIDTVGPAEERRPPAIGRRARYGRQPADAVTSPSPPPNAQQSAASPDQPTVPSTTSPPPAREAARPSPTAVRPTIQPSAGALSTATPSTPTTGRAAAIDDTMLVHPYTTVLAGSATVEPSAVEGAGTPAPDGVTVPDPGPPCSTTTTGHPGTTRPDHAADEDEGPSC